MVDKRKDYMKMSKTVASIFDALKYVLLIEPIYHTKYSFMKQLLLTEIRVVLKEKGKKNYFLKKSSKFKYKHLSKGASGPARASEIEAFCLNLFYRYFASSMTKETFQIFVFFHSFWMSIKKNWMKKSDDEIKYEKFVKKEVASKKRIQQDEPTSSEFDVFNALSNSLKISRQHTDVPITSYTHSHLKKPKFMSINNWISCIQLEKTLPKIFNGLTDSLANESEKWSEYFHYTDITVSNELKNGNTTEAKFDIDFLNECPLKNESLNIFYKFLLWTTAQSQRLIQLIYKFNVYNFGGLIPQHHEFDIDFFFPTTTPYMPNLVMVNKSSIRFFFVWESPFEKKLV